MTLLAADEADLAVLGEFGRRLEDAPEDPREEWRRIARPDQLLPDEPFRVIYYQGGRGCIAPWTRIWLPLEGRDERVDLLAAAGRPVTVLAMTEDGPRLAMTDGAPFAKGIADLYEVTTDDGHAVTVTAEHRFLTPRGWRRLADVRAGHFLAAAAPVPPGSGSCCRSCCPAGGQHSTRTTGGSPDHCRTCPGSCGPRPLPGSGSGRAPAPSRGGADGRTRLPWLAGDLDISPGCSPDHQRHSRPARSSSSLVAPWLAAAVSRERASAAGPSPRTPREPCRSRWYSSRLPLADVAPLRPRGSSAVWSSPAAQETISGPASPLRSSHGALGILAYPYPHFIPKWTRIRRITPAKTGVFYDLTVPGPANYLAEGLWHHNSGKTRSGAQGLAEIILSDAEPDGQFGVIGPTYRDAWTVQVEGDSGLLRALGTTAGEVKHGTSRVVEYAHRSYGEIGLRNGHVVFVDSADDGAIRVQGKNLRAAWCIAEGEPVVTSRGFIPVERVRPGDRVATRNGWRKVTARTLTRRDAEVVRMTTEAGQTLRLTGDHRVWTANRGWRMASDITPCDTIVLWNPTFTNSSTDHPLTSSGMVISGITISGPVITGTPPRAAFTSPSGSTSTSSAPLRVTTSTTPTTTRRTTTRRTSSSSRTASTSPITTARMRAVSPDGTPGDAARRRSSHGRARPASSPARSAERQATVPGKPPSTARTSVASRQSSPARKTWPGSTRTRRPTPRIPSGATPRRGSASAPSARSLTAPWPPVPSTALRSAAPRRWLRGAGRSPALTAAPCSRRLPRPAPPGARSAGASTTARPSARRGTASSPRSASASSAASPIRPSSRTTPSTAPSDAVTWPGWRSGSLTRCPEPDGTADVYDLTVEGEHEFFAGGILVHNCGEIGLWTRWATAWDESIKFAVRKGASKIICDGTPKVSRPARALIRRFLRGDEPGVIVRRLRTVDNAANLSEAFYQSVIGAAKGTRLERQELEGELLDDVENALWSRDQLERIQVPAFGQPGGPGYLWQAKVGVDPSDGGEDSDEQAYTVIGKGAPDDQHLYVAENWGGQEAPAPFARRCILKAVEYEAELVVEKNHGGEWLRATFAQVMKELVKEGRIPEGRCPRVRLVHASQAKRTRAEPVSAMYERDVVRHCKMASRDLRGGLDMRSMVEMEDQMVTFTGSAGERSPDRLDSLTWAATPFLNTSFGPPSAGGIRKWAGSQELNDIGQSEDARMRRRMRGAHGGAYDRETPESAPWSVDGFAPEDDTQQHPEHGRRGNVRSWR